MLGSLSPARFFGDAFREIDAETRAQRWTEAEQSAARRRCLACLAFACVMLTVLFYYADELTFRRLCRRVAPCSALLDSPYLDLYGNVWWAGLHVLGYGLLPMSLLRGAFRVPLADHGLSLGRTRDKLGLYLLLLGLVLPVVIGASFIGEFAAYYPFYRQASRSWFDLLCWELLYLAQFLALEYFFRGYLLAACRPTMGASAIFCMLLPYCMIHFGKPALEALGAIVAGLVLGTLALRTRSIWGGFLVHAGVAVTMDFAALLQGPGLPGRLWPG